MTEAAGDDVNLLGRGLAPPHGGSYVSYRNVFSLHSGPLVFPGGPISLGHVILTVAWVVDDPYHQIVSKEGR